MMIKNIKIMFIDLDGTICDDNSKILPYTSKVIKKVVEKGINVICCSGRTNYETIEMSKLMGASPIVVSSNGSLVFNYEENYKMLESNIKKEILKTIWNFSMQYNIGIALNTTYQRYQNKNSDKKAIVIDSIDELKDNVTQIVANTNNYDSIELLKEFIERTYKELECKNIWNNIQNKFFEMDICNQLNSKGKAIDIILNKLNIKKENSICFGDQLNDLSMFERCNIKVAMKNGNEKLKSNASFVTDFTNNEEGVAKFIDSWVL